MRRSKWIIKNDGKINEFFLEKMSERKDLIVFT